MISKKKSNHTVAIWVFNSTNPSRPKIKEYTFQYLPTNALFISDALNRVSLFVSSSNVNFVRVQSTDADGNKLDLLYSGYVKEGSVEHFEAQDVCDQYVAALLHLGVIDESTFDHHTSTARKYSFHESQDTAKKEFIASVHEIGLLLNKSQMLSVEKHFSGAAK